MISLLLIAIGQIYTGDCFANPYLAMTQCAPITVAGKMAVDAGSIEICSADTMIASGYLVADAGSFGGPIASKHLGNILGVPFVTCGAFTNVSTPWDGGVACNVSSTDMHGTLTMTYGGNANVPAGIFVTDTPYVWMKPNVAWGATVRCQISIPDKLYRQMNTSFYAIMDAGIMQIAMNQWAPTGTSFANAGLSPLTVTWDCMGQ